MQFGRHHQSAVKFEPSMGACTGKRETTEQDLRLECHNQFVPIGGYGNVPLVSLEIAVEPLICLLPSIQTYVRLVKLKCDNPPDGLTPDESAAIMLCTIRWQPFDQCLSMVLNSVLRSTDRQQLQRWFLYLKLLLTALCRLPSVPQTVYRGIPLHVHEHYPQDKVIIWWDFALCTSSLDHLQSEKCLGRKGRRTILTIESHSSKDVSKHSFYPCTDSVLLLPATQFKVVRCLKQKSKLCWIQLREIESPFVLLQSVSVVSELPRDSIRLDSPSNAKQSWTYRPSIANNSNPKLEQTIAEYPVNSPIYLKLEQVTNADANIIVRQAMLEKRCTELWLCNARLTSEAALILSTGLYNNTALTKLYLNDNRIGDRGVHALARVLSVNNSKLIELYLARNGIGRQGAQYIAEMLSTNRTLTTLSLFGNQIDDEGMNYFAYTLSYHNTTLEYLYLSGNNLMTDRSVDYLVGMFEHNRSLKKIHLFNCNLSERGKGKLRDGVQTKNCVTLHM